MATTLGRQMNQGKNDCPKVSDRDDRVAHLWAIGYEDMERAEQVRRHFIDLGTKRCLVVLDTAVAVRYPDGSAALDGKPFRGAAKLGGGTITGFFAGFALAAPLMTASAVEAFLECAGCATSHCGIDEGFVNEVRSLI